MVRRHSEWNSGGRGHRWRARQQLEEWRGWQPGYRDAGEFRRRYQWNRHWRPWHQDHNWHEQQGSSAWYRWSSRHQDGNWRGWNDAGWIEGETPWEPRRRNYSRWEHQRNWRDWFDLSWQAHQADSASSQGDAQALEEDAMQVGAEVQITDRVGHCAAYFRLAGNISGVNENGTFDVQLDNGVYLSSVAPEQCTLIEVVSGDHMFDDIGAESSGGADPWE